VPGFVKRSVNTVYQFLVTVAKFQNPLLTIINEKLSIFTDFIRVRKASESA
jgi:hypothetical protein